MIRELVISLAGLATACVSVDRPGFDPSTVAIPSPPAAILEPAHTILHGFGPLEEETEWRVGDRAVYAVHLRAGEKEHSWILELEVSAVSPVARDGSGRRVTYRISVYDELGSLLESSVSELKASSFAGADSGYAAGALAWSTREGPVQHHGDFGAQRIFGIILGNTALEPVLREVIDPPSLLEVLEGGGLGIGVFLRSYPSRAIRLPGYDPPLECYPHELEIFWQPDAPETESRPLVLVRPWFCEPKPPFHVGLGLVTMWIQHPIDAERCTWIHLVAARRSVPEPAPGS